MPSLADHAHRVALDLEGRLQKIATDSVPRDDMVWVVRQRPSVMALVQRGVSEKLGLLTLFAAAHVQLDVGRLQAPRHVKCVFQGVSRHRARTVARAYVQHVRGDATAWEGIWEGQ